MSDTVAASIELADSMIGSRSHICAFFHNAGFKRGERAFYIVIRTHPMIIVGGILQENPFFVPPDQFPQELRERQAHRTRSPPD